jgi:hypothetical protein
MRDATGYALPPDAVVVTAAGFEERALVAASRLGGIEHSTVVVVRYSHDEPSNRLEGLLAILRRRSVIASRVVQVAYDRLQPDDYPPLLSGALRRAAPGLVCVDVSAMSKLALMLTLDVCRQLDLDTVLFYVEARDYGPSFGDYAAAKQGPHLTRPTFRFFAGVQDVLRVRSLSSVAMQGQPLAAIVFMSFNELLTQALIDTVSPSRLFLINGTPPVLRWREEATAWIHEELRREWSEADNPIDSLGLPLRTTSTRDYRDTVRCILELYWRLASSHRILLAPTGAKMQALGAVLVRFIHPDIHIEYPLPQGDLNLQGIGVGPSWMIHFGRLGTACARWAALERATQLTIAL